MAATLGKVNICIICRTVAVGYYSLYCHRCGGRRRKVIGDLCDQPDPPGFAARIDYLAMLATLGMPLFSRSDRDDRSE